MHQHLNTLYITTPNAYAHLENDTLRVDVERNSGSRDYALPLLPSSGAADVRRLGGT